MQNKGKATTGESLPSALEAGSTSHSPPHSRAEAFTGLEGTQRGHRAQLLAPRGTTLHPLQ